MKYQKKYSPLAWLSLIFDVYNKHLIRVQLPLLIFVALFSIGLTYVLHSYLDIAKEIHGLGVFHSLLGVVLGLFLVLRTNTSYERWWEGRIIWGALVNDARSLAMKVKAFFPQDTPRRFFNERITNFVFSLKEHLRKGVKMEELSFEDNASRTHLETASHKPNALALEVFEYLNEAYKDKRITGEQLFILDKEIKAFVDHLGRCERIKKTPIAYGYAMFIKKFIFIYSLTLPFSFVPHIFYWSALPIVLIFYSLSSIEIIAEEIEDPFGSDANDLRLNEISETIRDNVREILLERKASPALASTQKTDA